MDDPTAPFEFLGLTFDWGTILSTLLAMAIVVIVSIVLTRKPSLRPGKRQNVIEYLLDFTNGIVGGQLKEAGTSIWFVCIYVVFLHRSIKRNGLVASIAGD